MELPQIGQQCGDSSCKQLDFLPLKCKCGKTFCSDHFPIHVETCQVSNQEKSAELKKIEGLYNCSHPNCTTTSIVPILCERCNKNFCIKHRHLTECEAKHPEVIEAEKEKYAAPLRQFNEAKAIVDKELDESLAKAKRSSKTSKTASKVQLMRLKSKAVGLKTIPIVDRIYFSVEYLVEKEKQRKALAVFVSKSWSVGRTIDAIAQECKMKNNNNQCNALKLRLFKKETGEILSKDLSVNLLGLMDNNILADGECLVLEYVNDNCERLHE